MLDRDAETPWEWLKKEIDHVFNTHEPLVDLDGDNFATMETFRGTSWRGRDCDDLDKSVYPGRNSTHYSADRDHNCNGIRGVAPSGRTYEQELCSSVPNKGVIALGDSATAHFRFAFEAVALFSDMSSLQLLLMYTTQHPWRVDDCCGH